MDFTNSLAIVIGINNYSNGIPPLRTAVNDARKLAELLAQEHGYDVLLLVEEVTGDRLRQILKETLPARVGPDDRVLVYFAGHGVALDGDDGPAGYLVPQDARPEDSDTFLSMHDVHQSLVAIPCRHMLVILDCCFAGAFRWSGTRSVSAMPKVIHRERYERYVQDPAWQVITSASYDQKALDVLSGAVYGARDMYGARDGGQRHSPFGRALLDALSGEGDLVPAGVGDGVITATELYLYLRDHVEMQAREGGSPQTPGLWPLAKHDKGEYVFLTPGRELNLPPAPPLTLDNNPYRGLQSYDEEHESLFFGRVEQIEQLARRVAVQPLTVVLGASGTGKSSLVKAGLIPHLRRASRIDEMPGEEHDAPWLLLPVLRPGTAPLRALNALMDAHLPAPVNAISLYTATVDPDALADRIAAWSQAHPGHKLLLVVDQFEELITLCHDDGEREALLQLLARAVALQPDCIRLVLTLRSDFEPLFSTSVLAEHWTPARYVVPPMSQDDLREVIEGPASVRVMVFEPHELVDDLINELIQTPGALPLLSFTLSELYVRYLLGQRGDRALRQEDYRALGGVIGSLRNRATQEYEQLDETHRQTMRRMMLRMVSVEGGELARRRVPRTELDYADEAENARVQEMVRRLVDARLVVEGREEDGEPYVEPAHDALVRAWDKLLHWQREAEEYLPLQRRVTDAARDWEQAIGKAQRGLLWDNDPRLPQLAQMLGDSATGLHAGRWLNRSETQFVQASIGRKRRNLRRLVLSIATVFAALLGLTVLSFDQRNRAVDEANQRSTEVAVRTTAQANEAAARQVAESSEARAVAAGQAEATARVLAEERQTEAERQAELATSRQLAAQAASLVGSERADLGLLLSLEANRITDTVEARSSLLASLAQNRYLAGFLHGHLDTVVGLAYSPDGGRLASAGCEAVDRLGICARYGLRLWDAVTHRQIAQSLAAHTGDMTSLAYSPAGDWIATGSRDRSIILWDAGTGQPVGEPLPSPSGSVESLAFSPDGGLLAVGTQRGLAIWDVRARQWLDSIRNNPGTEIHDVAFDGDGKRLALAGSDGLIRLWDVSEPQNGTEPLGEPLEGHTQDAISVAFSPDGMRLASASWDDTVILWDAETGEPLRTLVEGQEVGRVSFAPGGDWLALSIQAEDRERILLLDTDTGAQVAAFSGRDFLAWAPDRACLATGGAEGKVVLWDLDQDQRLGRALDPDVHSIVSLAFHPDGRWLALGGDDGQIRLWEPETQQQIGPPLKGHSGAVYSLAVSPNGSTLASGGEDATILLWDVRQTPIERIGAPLAGHRVTVSDLAFSPDGKRLVSGSLDNTIVLWDTGTGTRLRTLAAPEDVEHVAVHPDGAWLAAATEDGSVLLWDLNAKEPAARVLGNHVLASDGMSGLAFSPDGALLASSSLEDTILWDLASGRPIAQPFAGAFAAFSPDGRLLAASQANQVLLFDVRARRPLDQALGVHSEADYLSALAFHPDGTLLAAADDNQVWLWEISLAAWRQHACDIANRNLTSNEWERYLGSRPYERTCPDSPELPPIPLDTELAYHQAGRYVLEGQLESAAASYAQATQSVLETTDAELSNEICWYGSIDGFAETVWRACEHAIALDPDNAGYHDSRGLARALTGDWMGAIDDFQFYVDWAVQDSPSEAFAEKRRAWIEALGEGRNPFDELTLRALRNEAFNPLGQ